jgi:hypothetical protein
MNWLSPIWSNNGIIIIVAVYLIAVLCISVGIVYTLVRKNFLLETPSQVVFSKLRGVHATERVDRPVVTIRPSRVQRFVYSSTPPRSFYYRTIRK